MDILDKMEKSRQIYESINSPEYYKDAKELDRCEFFRKYYYFLPEELLKNIDKIYLEYDKIKNNN